MKRMGHFLSALAGFGLALCLVLFILAGLLEIAGTNGTVMAAMMRDTAPEADTGLPDSEYGSMALMITRYLAGASDSFQYYLEDGYGRQVAAFHDYEQAHMADCRALFVLDRQVLLVSAGLILLCLLLLKLRHDPVHGARGCLAGGILCLTAAGAICIWAAVDFNGIFVLFHRLSFSNNLWLLNPQTDLLIRLMPLSFFIRYVVVIAATWLISLLLLCGVSGMIGFRKRKNA